jgi:hypothetical protein
MLSPLRPPPLAFIPVHWIFLTRSPSLPGGEYLFPVGPTSVLRDGVFVSKKRNNRNRGSRIENRNSVFHGSRLTNLESRFSLHVSRFTLHSSCLPAPGFQNQSELRLCEGISRKRHFPRQKCHLHAFPPFGAARNRTFSAPRLHVFLLGRQSFLVVFWLNQKELRLREASPPHSFLRSYEKMAFPPTVTHDFPTDKLPPFPLSPSSSLYSSHCAL